LVKTQLHRFGYARKQGVYMAHECPDCGMRCHCGGDIDDIVFDDNKYSNGYLGKMVKPCPHCYGGSNNARQL